MTPFRLSGKACRVLSKALEEDLGKGDVTTSLLVPSSAKGQAKILARQPGVFCGAPAARHLCSLKSVNVKPVFKVREGGRFSAGKEVLKLEGRVASILMVERTLLNFLGRLCGIAAMTRRYADIAAVSGVDVFDTRKTTPLLREWEKYAVRTGGGKNHRMGLYDAVFVKENHRVYGLLNRLHKKKRRFEIEVRNKKELDEALRMKPAVILFDNFAPSRLKQLVRYTRKMDPQVRLEASGGITLRNLRAYASSGIDRISVGALTHSVDCLDFSLQISQKK